MLYISEKYYTKNVHMHTLRYQMIHEIQYNAKILMITFNYVFPIGKTCEKIHNKSIFQVKVSILQIRNTRPENNIEQKEKNWNQNQTSIVPRSKLMIFTTFSIHHVLVSILERASVIMFAFYFVQNYGIFNYCHKNTKFTSKSPYFNHSNTSILRSSMLDSSVSVTHD